MSRVLVTGALGFVGRVVCARLAEFGYTAIAGVRSAEQWEMMRGVVPAATSFRVLGDIRSAADFAGALEGVDTVVHLAGRAHIMRESCADPLKEFREANVHGTRKIAIAASARQVRRFVFVSTVKIHGDSSGNLAFSENDRDDPRDAYAISKCEAEKELLRIGRETGMQAVVVRPPLVYGPGVRANFFRLMQLANLSLPLPIPETRNRRSLVSVMNLADFLVHCVGHERASNETFLVSDGEDLSTRELITRLGRALGRQVHFLPFPGPLMRSLAKLTCKEREVSRLLNSLLIDSSKARGLLEWYPPTTVDEGLEATVRWYRAVCAGRIS